jgi:hypothetical protein
MALQLLAKKGLNKAIYAIFNTYSEEYSLERGKNWKCPIMGRFVA